MKLKNALILSAAVVALGMGSVSISKAYAADDKAAVAVKTDAAKPVKKAAHHKHHGKHVAVKKEMKTDAVVQTTAPATNQ